MVRGSGSGGDAFGYSVAEAHPRALRKKPCPWGAWLVLVVVFGGALALMSYMYGFHRWWSPVHRVLVAVYSPAWMLLTWIGHGIMTTTGSVSEGWGRLHRWWTLPEIDTLPTTSLRTDMHLQPWCAAWMHQRPHVDVVHVAVMAPRGQYAAASYTIKAVLLTRSSPLVVHVVTDLEGQVFLLDMFAGLTGGHTCWDMRFIDSVAAIRNHVDPFVTAFQLQLNAADPAHSSTRANTRLRPSPVDGSSSDNAAAPDDWARVDVLKLFLPELLPDVDQVIVLEQDTVVLGDITGARRFVPLSDGWVGSGQITLTPGLIGMQHTRRHTVFLLRLCEVSDS